MNNNLPTLSELPEKFDLTQISPEAARSNAVEALLQQNDDLMARLSVSLRRISELEDKLNFTQQSNEKMKFHYENLKDQVLILKQKAQALAQRKDDSEGFLKGLKDKIRYLEEERRLGEIRYAELYSSHE